VEPDQVPKLTTPLKTERPERLAPIPPTYRLPPIPTPPETVKAPVDVDVEAVGWLIATLAALVSFVSVAEPEIAVPLVA